LTLNASIVERVCVALGDHAGGGVEIDEVGALERGGQTDAGKTNQERHQDEENKGLRRGDQELMPRWLRGITSQSTERPIAAPQRGLNKGSFAGA
jgi:hypothetical protein